MIHRRLAAATTAVSLLLGSGTFARAQPGDFILSGVIAGMPSGRILEISITPDLDTTGLVKSIPLARATTSAGGRYMASVSIPADAVTNSDGRSITIQLASRDTRSHVLQVVRAFRDDGGRWVVDQTGSPQANFRARDFQSLAGNSEPDAVNCTGGYAWALEAEAKYVFVPLQKGFAEKNATVRYQWSNSNSTSFEALAGYRGASFYSLGLSHSIQDVADAGVKFTIKPKQRRAAMVEWKYRLSKEYCFLINNVIRATGNQKWVPYSFAGGNKKKKKKKKKSFKCLARNKSTVSSYTWVARTSSKTYGGYYSIAGIKIDARQTNSETNRISYTPRNGKRVTLCGSDDKIVDASMVKEIP